MKTFDLVTERPPADFRAILLKDEIWVQPLTIEAEIWLTEDYHARLDHGVYRLSLNVLQDFQNATQTAGFTGFAVTPPQ